MARPEEQRAPEAEAPAEGEATEGLSLPAQVLTEVKNLGLKGRMLATSAVTGVHRSRLHGSSVEFSEHKEYAPGDNLRDLDWRAYARLDRHYIKRFEDERNLQALFLIDSSESMAYPRQPGRRSKLEYSKLLAGTLAYVLSRQGDSVGLSSFSEQLQLRLPPRARRGQLQEVLTSLGGLEPSGKTALPACLSALGEGLRQRSLLLLFTDLMDEGLAALPKLAELSARGHELVLFHVLDPDEIDFPFEDNTLFRGMESAATVQIDAQAVRQAYLEEAQSFLREAESGCRAARAEYRLARSDEGAGAQLVSFLGARANIRAVRR